MWIRQFWIILVVTTSLCNWFVSAQSGCGLAIPSPPITDGQENSQAKFPWHVGIFVRSYFNPTKYGYICGGTLIRSDIVISAASCLYDEKKQHIIDSGMFKLAVGKVINTLHESEPNEQISNVTEILVPDRFIGISGNVAQDIAILRVNFTLSPVILPVCIDWSNTTLPLKTGDIGEVPSWGFAENSTNGNKLIYGNQPYIPYNQCTAQLPRIFVRFITPDKFCAGYVGEGFEVRPGDGGGGLVFQTNGSWYLRGVVSMGFSNTITYSAFTDVSHHIPWIKRVLRI